MDSYINFKSSLECTIGIELELQIIHPENAQLVSRSKEFLNHIQKSSYAKQIKPEITQSMIEINSHVHCKIDNLLNEIIELNNFLTQKGNQLNIKFSGGGTHPFQMWKDREIFPTARFKNLSQQYGYLAKRFTVFGQHIHVGCKNAEDAIYLTQALARYIPQFIALSASSPYYQGIDTTFDSSRSNIVLAFPTSGYMPYFKYWNDFCRYYKKLQHLNIIENIKNIYWDIRPQPELGTVEIRICDTPLTLDKVILLSAYAQTLAHYILHERPFKINHYDKILYHYNRYQASRFGFEGNFIDPYTLQHFFLDQDILHTLPKLMPHGAYLDTKILLDQIYTATKDQSNDARWLRKTYEKTQSFIELVKKQMQLWGSYNIV